MLYKPAHQSPMEMRGYTAALTQALRMADYLGWPIKLGHQGSKQASTPVGYQPK
jgi:hypothetical protein